MARRSIRRNRHLPRVYVVPMDHDAQPMSVPEYQERCWHIRLPVGGVVQMNDDGTLRTHCPEGAVIEATRGAKP